MVGAGIKQPMNKATNDGYVYKSFTMSDKEFRTMKNLIYDQVGIEIKDHKRHLLVNRLSKRLRHLGLASFSAYIQFIEDGNQQELIELIDAVTTNKTDFYREAKHFQFLVDNILPAFAASSPGAKFKVWSAACSSGEEPYTLAIHLNEFFGSTHIPKFEIVASDISETILRMAVSGIYSEERIRPIPYELLRKYFLKGNQRYKVKPELAKNITFKKINLKQDFQHGIHNVDVIFCRNVMIYFDRPTQEEIISKMWHVLKPKGFLFLGLSETMHGSKLPYKYVAPSVYQKI